MGKIKIENIRIYAYHGCLKEETKIGSDYNVDIEVKANLKTSSLSDNLGDTVNYVFLNKVVKEEMAIPSLLLETVARRVLNRVFSQDSMVSKAVIWVSKLNPPIGGDVSRVTVKMTKKRKK